MYRVQRSSRLTRERLACTIDNLRTNTQHMPVGGRGREMRASIRGLGLRELAERGGTPENPLALDDCEV